MLSNEQNQKHYWCWEFERLSHNSGVEEVSLERMDEKNHDQQCDDDTPSRILHDTSQEDRNTPYEDSQYRNKTREKYDASEGQEIWKYIASTQ